MHFIPRMRGSDIDEVRAVDPDANMIDLLCQFVAISHEYWMASMFDTHTPLALYGIAELPMLNGEKVGAPWMLCTEEVAQYPLAMYREAKLQLNTWRRQYGYLQNFVDARNKAAIAFIESLGFDVLPPVPHGVHREPFHPFNWHNEGEI